MKNSQNKYSIDSLQLSNMQSNSALKILIVDDAESDRVSYVRYLQSDSERSYRIIEAETLEEGLEFWQSQQPDVVLLDINLPDGDGLEFLEAIGTDQLIKKLPVIMLTGQGDERIAVRAMKFGAADYLVKGDVTSVLLLTSIAQVHENNLLFKQLRRSQQQQTVIASMALHIRRAYTFEAVSNTIVQEIRSFLDADRAIIYRFNPDMSGEIVAEAVISPWDSCLNVQVEDTCFQENCGGEYQNGNVFVANDIYDANLTECHIQLLERFQVKANLVAPILLNGMNTLWGLLIVHQCDAPRQWHEEDIQLLHQLSTHLAISLYQAELYQNMESLNSSLEEKVQKRTQEIQLQAQMLDQIHDAVVSTTLDGTIQTWNIGAERLYEYEPHEVIGQNVGFMYEDAEALGAEVIAPLLDKGSHATEVVVLSKSGKRIYISLRLSVAKDEQGNITHLIGCANDISDRKRTEQELQQLNHQLEDRVERRTASLRESEQRFISLAAAAPVAIFRINQDNNCTYVNGFWTQITGQEAEVALGYGWIEIIHPDDREQVHQRWTQAIEKQEPYQGEGRCIRPDGTISFYYCQILPEFDDHGVFIGYIGTLTDITNRKQTEAALIESEAKFRRLVEGANDLIWATDANWCFNYLSPQFQILFGFDPNDWIGKSVFNLVHPEDLDWVANEYVQAIQSTQKFSRTEFRHRHQDGHYLWVSINTTPIINAEGIVIGAQGIVTDISDRKQAEQEILDNQRFIQQIADSSPNVLYLYDLQEKRNTYANRETLTSLGYTATEIQKMGASWLTTVMHPDDLLPTLEYFERLRMAEDGEILCHEYRLRHINGEWRYFYSRDSIFSRDAQGQVKLIIGNAQDITDRKITEAALRASDQRWQFALESAGDGIWDWNVETNEVFYSRQWKFMLGYADDEIENRFESWEKLVHPDDLAQSYKDINKCLNIETLIYENEHRLRCKDGSYKWILARGKAIEWGANGRVLRMMGTHTDLSARKQADIQLQQINEELIRATKLKDEFLANMSHELRTPLNSILGLSNALGEQILGSLNERQIKAIGTVESSGEHLLSLINDILDLSKISSGMMELNTESVSVKNLCDSSLVFVRQQAFQKKVQLNSNIPKNINKINVEERRIRQVLINLLTNAVKFTPSGGQVNLIVAVGGGDTWQGEATIPQRIKLMNSPMIVFQVVDTGIGIAPKDLQRLFQPFVQVSSSLNRQYEGTGLGLALVKQIVELHGGQVMAESEIGKGSSFSVALPYDISQSSTPESTTVSTTLEPVVIDPDHAPLILLAEDNEANILTFMDYLTAINYRIVIARNGEEAVAMAKSESPDIIIMDIQMPGMDGLEAIGLIRADASIAAIPIIALTALAMEGDCERCLAAGANEYLTKPIKFRELNTVIQQILK
jgi:PAS domain S-box-containing protein